jgi:hypothetical protein
MVYEDRHPASFRIFNNKTTYMKKISSKKLRLSRSVISNLNALRGGINLINSVGVLEIEPIKPTRDSCHTICTCIVSVCKLCPETVYSCQFSICIPCVQPM